MRLLLDTHAFLWWFSGSGRLSLARRDHGHNHVIIVVISQQEECIMPIDGATAKGPRTIKASEFKAKCLKLMDEVAESGEEIVITKNGRPVSRLLPYREKTRMAFGRNRDNIRVLGDIVEPMPAEWFEAADDSDEELF